MTLNEIGGQLQDALIDFYLSIKIRKNTEVACSTLALGRPRIRRTIRGGQGAAEDEEPVGVGVVYPDDGGDHHQPQAGGPEEQEQRRQSHPVFAHGGTARRAGQRIRDYAPRHRS